MLYTIVHFSLLLNHRWKQTCHFLLFITSYDAHQSESMASLRGFCNMNCQRLMGSQNPCFQVCEPQTRQPIQMCCQFHNQNRQLSCLIYIHDQYTYVKPLAKKFFFKLEASRDSSGSCPSGSGILPYQNATMT